ncbi:NrsF family protein [Lichenihabitans psoromatis]|uniref:NrsF family protein n=1 Tax=Lichenihabitans psoromatis TaxID=2528642 RepID=UPI001035FA58|nr:NrsF family protein [Lichenihabitans psoromatis]
MAAHLETLIDDLGADLTPVHRLASPLIRAAGWVAVVAAIGVAFASVADLPAVLHRLRMVPDMWLAVLGSTMTMVLAAVAAFEMSMPDRKATWALLPLPGVVLWVAATGMGCLRSWIIPDVPAAPMAEAPHCFAFIVGLSIPLSIVMIVMVRRACPLRPNLTAAIGGLAVAAGAATLLNFFHDFDAGATDIAVHVVAIALVIGLNRLLGGRLFAGRGLAPRA